MIVIVCDRGQLRMHYSPTVDAKEADAVSDQLRCGAFPSSVKTPRSWIDRAIEALEDD